ncbi:MAG: aldose 1-epimerase family protein [Hespellia sp.]|nr:aldose 1-epimerase family protein [Hespellia sp.]
MNHILSNEHLEVKLTELGGTLSSIKDKNGIEYLWQGDAAYWSGTAPVLFPICGSIRNDKAESRQGMQMAMPRHGIVRKSEFIFEGIRDDAICFSITSNEETLKKFPYEFKLTTRYGLAGKSVNITYEVENTGDKDMPFFIGGHPGFNCPLVEDEDYNDCYVEFEKEETCTVPIPVTETGLIDMEHRTACLDHAKTMNLKHELFRKDAVIFDELQSRKIKLLSKKSKTGVELSFDDFPYIILWSSANDGPFVAIEPWVGLSTCSDESDVFEEKRNVQVVKPGEKKAYTFTITVL